MLQLFYLITAGILIFFIATRPHLALRPSMWFALVMITRINSMAAFAGPELDEGFRQGHTLRMLTILFPIGIFLWVLATPGFSSLSRILAARCRNTLPAVLPQQPPAPPASADKERRITLFFLAAMAGKYNPPGENA